MELKTFTLNHPTKSGFQNRSCDQIRDLKILPCFSIVQAVEGSYDITLGHGEPACTGEGGFFLAPAHVQQDILHHVNPQTGRMTARWIFFELTANDAYPIDTLYDFPTILPSDKTGQMNQLFDALFETADLCEAYSLYYRIFGLLLSVKQPKKEGLRPEMETVLDYIQAHYREKISVHTLAELVHTSEPNFYVLFKKQFHLSPIVYINRYRMSLASELLRKTDQTLTSIADATGFTSPLYFSRLFKDLYHMSPTAYRCRFQD